MLKELLLIASNTYFIYHIPFIPHLSEPFKQWLNNLLNNVINSEIEISSLYQ